MDAHSVRTPADAADYARRRLGYPTVAVELDDRQLLDCVDDAVRLFNRYLMVLRPHVAKNQEVGTYLQMDETTRGVYHCCFLWPEAERDILKMNIFEIMVRMAYPPFELGEWYLLRSFYEMFQRVRGADPQWRYDPETKRLYIDVWGGPYDVAYITGHDVAAETLLVGSKARYAREFLDACVAYVQQRLAYIRGKFGGIPAPAGTLTTDADRMASQSETALKDIEEKLRRMSRAHYLPVMG